MRFLTSIAMAGLPSSRVIVSASLKVERIVASSLARTTAFVPATIGRLATSCDVLDQRRNFYGVAALRALDVAGGNQAVRGSHGA